MLSRRLLFPSLILAALTATQVHAHFLFVRILPPAEGGRSAEIYFSELAEAGDPRYIDKIAETKLWLQTTTGKFEPLKVHKAPDRLRAWLPYAGSAVVVGECRYGVLARAGKTPFLLRHFPKAMAGTPAELNAMKPLGKLPLEIVATVETDGLRFTALRDGKPMPKAEFITVDANLKNEKFTADAAGTVTWKPSAPGNYAVYTRDTRKETGEADGKKYEEIRDFATLAFAWPLERKDADPAAVALFEEAIAARSSWKDFPGFTATIAGNLDGRRFDGTVSIDAKGAVVFSDNDQNREESVAGWVQEQLESIVLHRLARPSSPDRPKPVLRFGEDRTDHPLGRLLVFDGGKFASSYRVKDKQIMVVNRHIGKENMTITILENDKNPDGLFLPRGYTVQYWDAATGGLTRTETIQDRWQRVGAWDLPAQHTVTTATQAGVSVRTFSMSKHELKK
ncbi:hypothetical protein AYO44_03420 [Planctomycetaceae bacterium SCGC AG-212-F19]|nr:hypothetical protein AYO44_03420 [Planctomycetaceae bacterium SCGC AG-212-F19]